MARSDRSRRARAAVRRGAESAQVSERLLEGVRRLRTRLPGDQHFGDPLSTGQFTHLDRANRQLSELTEGRPGVWREMGLGALQVWQSVLESRGRDRGDVELTVVFTDLVGFSSWALDAGDDDALTLLRQVAAAVEPPVTRRGGEVVKRLGDGMMAVFSSPQRAVEAVCDGMVALADVSVAGHQPRMRAGMHTGRPRKLGGDYLGIDVNIAARVAEKASPGELLASAASVSLLDPSTVSTRRKRSFSLLRAKGVPDELEVFAVTRM
jgi:adenylate cyclase